MFHNTIGCHDRTLLELLTQLPQDIKEHVTSLCIDGTSSTALLVDSKRGDILARTKLYNEDQGIEPLNAIKVGVAPVQTHADLLHQGSCRLPRVSHEVKQRLTFF